VPFQSYTKLRKKINIKLYLTRIILILENLPSTPEVLDNNCNILLLVYYTFTVF